MATCSGTDCTEKAIMAIRNLTPRSAEGLVTHIYQFEEDAPRAAVRYCGPCGVHLAANLAALSDRDLTPVKVILP